MYKTANTLPEQIRSRSVALLNRHLVAASNFDQRSGARVQGNHPFLNQGRELEAAAHLVDNRLFFQFVKHGSPG